MKTISEIRRKNLNTIINESGGRKAFSDKLGRDYSQISQWVNASIDSTTKKPREISSKSARRIENIANKKTGWLDVEHGKNYVPKTTEAEEAAKIIDEIIDDQTRIRILNVLITLTQPEMDIVSEPPNRYSVKRTKK